MRIVAIRFLCLLMSASVVTGQSVAPDDHRVEAAVDHAIGFLREKQREDGSITDKKNATAMTALAVLAFSAAGHQATDSTPEGTAVRAAVEYLLQENRQEENGYLGKSDGSRMYGHGIITLCLSELLGMGADEAQDDLIRRRLTKAVELILASQNRKRPDNRNHYGGWRYTPDSNDSDLSVTIWQLMALRSAQNAGMEVPSVAIDKAIRYLKVCFEQDKGARDGHGAFAYEPGRQPTYSTAAAGLLAMQVCGEYDAHEVKDVADWLAAKEPSYDETWFFYGTYYFAQGMHQRGGSHAEFATRIVERILLNQQEEDGSWDAVHGQEREAGRVYSTALAVMSLSVRYHYLPIYQR